MKMSERRKQARILIDAQAYRRRFVANSAPFEPISHIERELPYYVKGYDYHYVPSLQKNGTPIEARVTFSDGILLEVTEQALREAFKGIGSARFTLCHEIAHIILHAKKMAKNASVMELARGRPMSGTSFYSNPDEEREANLFAGALLIPTDVIAVETGPMELARKYKTSPYAAKEARFKVLEVWSTILEMRNGSKP